MISDRVFKSAPFRIGKAFFVGACWGGLAILLLALMMATLLYTLPHSGRLRTLAFRHEILVCVYE